MLLVDGVIGRLEAQVPALANRVKGALDLSELIRKQALPQYTPGAFVTDNGMVGRTADSSAGAFLQLAEETVSVLLILRTAGDVTGAKTQPKLSELKWQVIYALDGWAPEVDEDAEDETGTDPIGVLELRRGRVNSLDAGTVFYQLDFAIVQQIRVIA